MSVTKSFNIECYEGQRILIYGAGRYGKLAFYGLKALGMEVYAFVDGFVNKADYLGIQVLSANLLSEYTQDIVLIASLNCFGEMYSIARSQGCENIYDISELINIEYDESVLNEYEVDEKHSLGKYQRVVDSFSDDKLIITHVELVVTEKCTLRCRDCANLIQYYEKPQDLPLEEMCSTFDRLLDTIDALLELRILGGEPFIYKDLDVVLDRYISNDKVKSISIYTNGTMVPSGKILDKFNAKKISVHISNYGEISRKVNELIAIFTERNIAFYVHTYNEWIDMEQPACHNYDEKQLELLFNKCSVSSCYTFYRGKLYHCPRAAHGEAQGIFIHGEDEVIDFNVNEDKEIKKKQVKKMMEDVKYLAACNYCNGWHADSKVVAAAEQN